MADKTKKLCTCAICYRLSRKATALRKCNHIFCWKCINGKITKHDWKCCPVCYVEFGPDPLLRLRHDDPIFESLRTEDMEMIFESSDGDETDESENFDDDEETDESEDSDDEEETDESENSDDDDTLFEISDDDEMSESEYSDDGNTESYNSDDECIPIAMDTESESD